MHDAERLLALFRKLEQGTCTPEELEALDRLRASAPADRAHLQQTVPLSHLAHESPRTVAALNVTLDDAARQRRALARTAARLGLAMVADGARADRSHQHRQWAASPLLRVAAALVIATGLGVGVWAWMRIGGTGSGARVAEVAREFHTAPGQRASVVLPDGSRAVLAPETHLTYAASATARRMQLDGEAYFTVVHDPRHPLTVRAADATVTDIGTTFDLRAYPDDSVASVAVVEGRVAVTRAPPDLTPSLEAGDVATIDRGVLTVAHVGDVEAYVAWTTGRLVFQHTPLGTVAAQLTRWYGVPFRVADTTLAAQHVRLTLTTQPVAEAAAGLCAIADADCSRDREGAIVITPKRNNWLRQHRNP